MIKRISRNKIFDQRGWFLKIINGKEIDLNPKIGEFYVTVAKPNQSRGGHFHRMANEWFTLLSGQCKLMLFDVNNNKSKEIILCEKKPETIYVPAHIAHLFINISNSDFTLLAYSDIVYNPNDTISHDFGASAINQ